MLSGVKKSVNQETCSVAALCSFTLGSGVDSKLPSPGVCSGCEIEVVHGCVASLPQYTLGLLFLFDAFSLGFLPTPNTSTTSYSTFDAQSLSLTGFSRCRGMLAPSLQSPLCQAVRVACLSHTSDHGTDLHWRLHEWPSSTSEGQTFGNVTRFSNKILH